MQAIHDWVIIKRDTTWGTAYPSSRVRAVTGLVQSVGEGARSKTTGDIVPIETPAVGDHIAYVPDNILVIDGHDAVRVEDVIAVEVPGNDLA